MQYENFSVLLSVYKYENEDFFRAALNSVARQTVQPREVVIVQDGPIPPSLSQVLERYEHPNKVIVSLKENVGLGKALSIGLHHCSYELVARVDSDDINVETRFAEELQAFREDSELDVLGSWIAEFEGTPETINFIRKTPTTYQDVRKSIGARNPLNHMTVMFKKSSVLDAGNYQHLPYGEDYYLWMRILSKSGKIRSLPKILVYARTGGAFYLRRGGLKYLSTELRLQRKLLELHIIGMPRYILNLYLRIIPRLLPASALGYVYTKFLRMKAI